MIRRTFLCRLIFCAIFSVSIINVFTGTSSPNFFLRHSKTSAHPNLDSLHCPTNDVADDVLVVLRTGATESREKVPVHFRTTLRCVPHFVIVSDLNEVIDGHQVFNVLDDVTDKTKNTHEDFKLYHHLQEHGRTGLGDQKVITTESGSSKGDYLNTESPGWKLDKWKFLPMIDLAYQTRPSAKWFVFIESDTYLFWNNLLEYLENFDASKPYYIGKHLYINDVEFGYGGAGFALSNPAMEKVVERKTGRVHEYEDFTSAHWVGDCALGKVLEDAKVPLHRAYPHLQGDSPATMDPKSEKIDRGAWCFPVVTYHHVSPSEIDALWKFEQDWHMTHSGLIRHRDIFTSLVRPSLAPPPSHTRPSAAHHSVPARQHWDNLSVNKEYTSYDRTHSHNDIERKAWQSFERCRDVCESIKSCMQFSYRPKKCMINYAFKLGYHRPTEDVQSGYMIERIDEQFRTLEGTCGVRDWFSPSEGSPVWRK